MACVYWSRLQRYVTSSIARAIVVFALVPYLLTALDVVGLTHTSVGLNLNIMLAGSFLVIVAYGIHALFCPELITSHHSVSSYVDRCIRDHESLIPADEFSDLTTSITHAPHDPVVARARNLGDPQTFDQRGIQRLPAIRTLAHARYLIHDATRPCVRCVCVLGIMLGTSLLYWPMVARAWTAIGR